MIQHVCLAHQHLAHMAHYFLNNYITQANLNCLDKISQLFPVLWGFLIRILVPKEQQWTKGTFITLGLLINIVTLFFLFSDNKYRL